MKKRKKLTSVRRMIRRTTDADRKSAERFWDNKDSFPEHYDITDNGAGVQRMIREIDAPYIEARENLTRAQRTKAAIEYARRRCTARQRLVLALVLKNGTNRKESIWELSKILKRRGMFTTAVCSDSHENSSEEGED